MQYYILKLHCLQTKQKKTLPALTTYIYLTLTPTFNLPAPSPLSLSLAVTDHSTPMLPDSLNQFTSFTSQISFCSVPCHYKFDHSVTVIFISGLTNDTPNKNSNIHILSQERHLILLGLK